MSDLSWIIKFLDLRLRIWLGLAAACTILVFDPIWGLSFLSDIPAAITVIAKVGLVFFFCLSAASILAAVWRGIEWIGSKLEKIAAEAKHRKAVEVSLNDLTEVERSILAFLVTRGERHFTTDIMGGSAAGLIGRGLIHLAAKPGHSVNRLATPFTVDNDVWTALLKRKDEFKHPNPNGRPPYSNSPW